MRTEEQVLIAMFEALIPWYEAHKRELPWRQDREPYHVWLSEIMLQQTRVEAVKEYYRRFVTALPTIPDLAEAPEEQILKLWEGLGYYNRVRNLQKAAQTIARETGAGIYTLDPCVSGDGSMESYENIMRENARVLTEAFAQ